MSGGRISRFLGFFGESGEEPREGELADRTDLTGGVPRWRPRPPRIRGESWRRPGRPTTLPPIPRGGGGRPTRGSRRPHEAARETND